MVYHESLWLVISVIAGKVRPGHWCFSSTAITLSHSNQFTILVTSLLGILCNLSLLIHITPALYDWCEAVVDLPTEYESEYSHPYNNQSYYTDNHDKPLSIQSSGALSAVSCCTRINSYRGGGW